MEILAKYTEVKTSMNANVVEPCNDNDIQVSIEERHVHLQWSLKDNCFILILDNGANSCLISTKAFHIEPVVQHHFATIKGYKDSYVNKGIRIGTGLAVVITGLSEFPLIGIQVNEAAIHDAEDDTARVDDAGYNDLPPLVPAP